MTDYDFRGLSPIDFEALVRDLLTAETDMRFETFAVGTDGGIDCRSVSADGTTIAQCKHRPDATKAQMVAAAKAELAKLVDGTLLTEQGGEIPAAYYFVTSTALTPGAVTAVATALGALAPSEERVWARGRLNGALTSHPTVERRHFKLWLNSAEVFDRIVGSGEWERNEALIKDIQYRIPVYVHTPKYEEAHQILRDQRVVLISGAPGVGKTTLAEMLLLNHWEAGWKVNTIISDVADAWRHVRDDPAEKVIFYYDDFLGQSSSLELQKNEGSDLALLIRAIQRSKSGNALLVMTTREQILNTALTGPDERIQRALADQKRIMVEMDAVTRSVRARMLFNHLYFAYRGKTVLTKLSSDTRYRSIIDHPGFNPRVLESVVAVRTPPTADALYRDLLDALDHPEAIWSGSFKQLSKLAMRILLNLAIEPARSILVKDIEPLASSDDPRAFHPALKVLEGTWVRLEPSEAGPRIRLYDPSRRDFLLDQLESGPMFRQALSDATNIQQVEHLVKYRYRLEVFRLINASIRAIDDRATLLFDRSLSRATDREYTRRQTTAPDRHVEFFMERMAGLTSAATLISMLPDLPQLTAALESALGFLDEESHWSRRPTASALFRLATELDELQHAWAHTHAEECVVIGVKAIQDADELRDYANLPDDLRRRTDSDRVSNAIQQAIDGELDGIQQQSDPHMMSQWLDEVESIASDLGIMLYLDSIRDRIDEMPQPPARFMPRAVQDDTTPHDTDGSDAAIADLFLRLNNPDCF